MSTFYAASANPNKDNPAPQSDNPPQQKSKFPCHLETENSQQDIFDRQIMGNKGGRSAFLKE